MNPHLTRFVPLLIRILISDDFILEKQRQKTKQLHYIQAIHSPVKKFCGGYRDVLTPAPKVPLLLFTVLAFQFVCDECDYCASFWRPNELIAGVMLLVLI